MAHLMFKDARLFDGSGTASRRASVRIRDGRIAEISEGPLPTNGAEVIACNGRWLTPGFLDIHTHYDAEVLAAPGLQESVRHGVTTVLLGSCSLSTVLCDPTDCADMFARVEALPYDFVSQTLTQRGTWSDATTYVSALNQLPLGPHIACLMGHSDLRAHVMGLGRSVDPQTRPSADELGRMEGLLDDALDAGFVGMSTMTNPWDKLAGDRFRSAQLPSSYAQWSEYRRLNAVLRRRDRVHQGAPNITTKFNVLLYLAQSASWGVRRPLKTTLITAADTKAEPFIAGLVTWAAQTFNNWFGANFRWQTLPCPFEVRADGIDLVVFEEFGAGRQALHQHRGDGRDALLADPEWRAQFRSEYAAKWSPRVWHRDFYDATIVSAPDPALSGHSFGELADERGQHPVDCFCDLVLKHGADLRWRTVIANHRPDVHRMLLMHPAAQVGFADSGAHLRNMAFYDFPLHLLRMAHAAERGGPDFLSPERAVHRLTAEIADWYGLQAGRIEVGARADVVLIDPEQLGDALDQTHEAPMPGCPDVQRLVCRNDAVVATVISGELVYRSGVFAKGFGSAWGTGQFLPAGKTVAEVSSSLAHVA
jgi:N-acyl-D-aspartate/D-glutamate deacylase